MSNEEQNAAAFGAQFFRSDFWAQGGVRPRTTLEADDFVGLRWSDLQDAEWNTAAFGAQFFQQGPGDFGPEGGAPPGRFIRPRFSPGNDHYRRQEGRESLTDNRKHLLSVMDTLRKFNLRFSGNEDPDIYLLRLREVRDLTLVSDADLLTCLPVMFSGLAAEWFRDRRAQWASFEDFATAFSERFLEVEYRLPSEGDASDGK